MEFFKKRIAQLCKVIVITSLVSDSTHAAQRVGLQHLSFSELQQLIPVPLSHQAARQFILPTPDLLFVEQHIDQYRTEHVRMQQQYAGIPVLGGYAIFHHQALYAADDSIRMNGALYQQLAQDLGARPDWFLSKANDVLQRYQLQFPSTQIINAEVMPMIYVNEQNKALWAYQVSVFLQPDDHMPSRPTAIVDATTEHRLLSWDDLPTALHLVHGLGFGGNRKIGKYQYGKELPFLELIRDDDTGYCFLENYKVRVVDMHHHTQQANMPMSFECEEPYKNDDYWTGYDNDGYDQINGGYSVANDAMYMGGVVKDMYRKQYGQEVLYNGQSPMQLILRVHYGTHFANAFWDGRQMTFGDGDDAFHPMVSLGIAAHEISHGFTQQHSGLVYRDQAGGMNESFSDMAAQAAEYYAQGRASWVIGADILKDRGALRFLRNPSRDGMSIDRADQYQKGMDVHYSSGVYNNLFYILANRPNWHTAKAFQVMLKANMDYWTPTSTFIEGACGVLSASRDLGFREDDVMYALDEVDIDYSDC